MYLYTCSPSTNFFSTVSRITIHVRLPESKCGTSKGKGGKVVEIGVNPKLDDTEVRLLLCDWK